MRSPCVKNKRSVVNGCSFHKHFSAESFPLLRSDWTSIPNLIAGQVGSYVWQGLALADTTFAATLNVFDKVKESDKGKDDEKSAESPPRYLTRQDRQHIAGTNLQRITLELPRWRGG